jgi:S-adenosylmethionine/arginine decarboxylase-like enzyme
VISILNGTVHVPHEQGSDFAFMPYAPAYGWHLISDLRECDPKAIDDYGTLRTWVIQLVKVLGMQAYGDPFIESFAHDDPVTAGYSVVQLITTSSITAHLSPHLGTAHIDVFSCRQFAPEAAVLHTVQAFGADETLSRSLFIGRG